MIQLRKLYDAVETIRGSSGFAYTLQHGGNVTIEREDSWNRLVAVCFIIL